MQRLVPGRPWLLEICPAVTLKKMGLYRPYKGRTPGHAATRRRILGALLRDGLLPLPAALRDTILADRGGDALDSLIAACTAYRLTRRGGAGLLATVPAGHAERAALEAWVFC